MLASRIACVAIKFAWETANEDNKAQRGTTGGSATIPEAIPGIWQVQCAVNLSQV
jgi:hypothetical protein